MKNHTFKGKGKEKPQVCPKVMKNHTFKGKGKEKPQVCPKVVLILLAQ